MWNRLAWLTIVCYCGYLHHTIVVATFERRCRIKSHIQAIVNSLVRQNYSGLALEGGPAAADGCESARFCSRIAGRLTASISSSFFRGCSYQLATSWLTFGNGTPRSTSSTDNSVCRIGLGSGASRSTRLIRKSSPKSAL
jgi:hypothetical protein